MHQPRPFGRHSNEELSPEDKAAIDLFARKLTNLKNASQLDGFKMVRQLPSGKVAVASDLGGSFRITVHTEDEKKPFKDEGVAKLHIPALISGAITRHKVLTVGDGGKIQPVKIRLTAQCRKRLAGYDQNKEIPKELELRRFSIEYATKFKYFKPKKPGIYTFTQYGKLLPTWYSGAMSEVVQVICGFGAQRLGEDREQRDDRDKSQIEYLTMNIPAKVYAKIKAEIPNTRMPGYSGIPDEEGKIKYEYKPAGNNAVSFDDKGGPWLLQISASGVYAMPLPVVPATTTDAFREWVEEKGDTEITHLLDKYGGIPTGEQFPKAGKDFEAWRRAGVIIKVCDTAGFYEYDALYPACGWSFNSKGTEAFNTCVETRGDYLRIVHAYQASFELAATEQKAGYLPETGKNAEEESLGKLSNYLSKLYDQLNNNEETSKAIKYKLRRYSGNELLVMFDSNGTSASYWDSLEAKPIAVHSGNIKRFSSGPAHFPGRVPLAAGWIKFPELTGEGCESFVFVNPEYKGDAPKCETIMFGAYINDELCTVRYFYDERKFKQEEESTFDTPMITGQWEKKTTTGMSGLSGHAYTNWADDRAETAPSVVETRVKGMPIGYGEPQWNTPGLFFRVGALGRSWYYEHETEVETENYGSNSTATLVPVFARDSINYAYKNSADSWSKTVETSFHGIPDPTSYQFWTHDPIFHYMDQTNNGNIGDPRPKIGEYVYLDTLIYTPYVGSEYADSGNWYGFSGGFMDVTGIVGSYTIRHNVHNANGVVIGGQAPGWERFYSKEEKEGDISGRLESRIMFSKNSVVHKKIPHPWYFQFSPTDSDFYFYQDASWNCSGKTEYSSISEEKQKGTRYSWGKTDLAENGAFTRFIGVVNE